MKYLHVNGTCKINALFVMMLNELGLFFSISSCMIVITPSWHFMSRKKLSNTSKAWTNWGHLLLYSRRLVIPWIRSTNNFQHSLIFSFQIFTLMMTSWLTPELYTTPWFITLFASKSNFKIAHLLFEYFMILKDRCFIFYFNVAVLIHHKKDLINLDQAILPQQVTGIKITTET
jgi:hypothetical protein